MAFSKGYRQEKYEGELANLCELEQGLYEDVNFDQIEGLIRSIINASGAQPTCLPIDVHMLLHENFNQSSLNALYRILLDIVENLPSLRHRKIDLLI